ncbi:ATP-dependent helicase [Bacillus paranthracis]|uniref:ATP-dependent helicase n=1 Tax=Bacillus paranthracis TaxID=2026186 RepID=UPI00187A4F86|nr:ATP-dependent helicase [Bacillus paranthracis]MBE7114665.1 ATP-dependent helicase [Bacillus paranthracis]MBE7154968.1 ATP-dependent helicase [Bacillus paranthracis]
MVNEVVTRIGDALGIPFSEEQEAVIMHEGSPLNVLSCAGSGKTTILVARMLKREIADKVAPTNMLAITFSRKAKDEMEMRYKRSRRIMGMKGRGAPTFKTFHAFFLMLLASVPGYKNISVASEGKFKYGLMKLIRSDGTREKDDIYDEMMSYRSQIINKGISPDGVTNLPMSDKISFSIDNYIEVMEKYKEMKKAEGVIDFDDMQVVLREALVERKADTTVRNFRTIFKDIYVDEYQDISPIQTEIMELLMGENTSGFVAIGDDDQSIYSFRGADPKYIMDFLYRYVGAKRLFLSVNYRCSQNILYPVIPSISRNMSRVRKSMEAFNEGGEVLGIPMGNNYAKIVDILREDLGEDVYQGDGADVAILVRQNSQRVIIADALAEAKIPVDIISTKWSLRNNKIYKVLTGIVDMIKKDDGELFAEHCNKIFPHIHKRLYDEYKNDIRQSWYENVVVYDFYHTPANSIDLAKKIKGSNNMGNCIGYAWKLLTPYYTRLSDKGFYSMDKVKGVVSYVYRIAKGVSVLEFKQNEKRKETLLAANIGSGSLQISTLHSVKGLEYDIVYMVGLDNDLFPCLGDEENNEELEEERRLFYVGSTRAKKKLVYAYNEKNPTMFLQEVDVDLPKIVKKANRG